MMGATMKDWDKDSDQEEPEMHSGGRAGESDSDWQHTQRLNTPGFDAFRESIYSVNLIMGNYVDLQVIPFTFYRHICSC